SPRAAAVAPCRAEAPRPSRAANRGGRRGSRLLAVLGVADRLHPLRPAAEADVDLDEGLIRRRAMPVRNIRPGIVALTNADVAHRAALLLRAHAPLLDQQQLTLVVAVPVGARAGIEMAARRAEILAIHHVRLAGELRRLRGDDPREYQPQQH